MPSKRAVDGIRAYLDGLGVSDKPVVDKEAVKALKAQIRAESDAINKLKLHAALHEEQQGRTPDRSGDRAVFIAEAKSWADAEGVPATAFQAMGVPDDVLKEAGFEITGASSAARPGGTTRRSSGPRAPRLPIDEVEAAAKSLKTNWKLADLAEKLDRDPATARNYLRQLIEAGTVKEIGDDPSHDGRGRAPKLYNAS